MRLGGVFLVVAFIGAALFAAYWLLRDDSDEQELAIAIPSPSPAPSPTLIPPPPRPTPKDEPVPAAVQRVLDVLIGFREDAAQISGIVGVADWSCSRIEALQTSGGCGSATPSFLVNLPTTSFLVCEATHQRDSAAAALIIHDRLGRHAAWQMYALTHTPLFIGEPDGYVLAYRAATGNFGVLLYIDANGYIVGMDDVCVQGVGIERQLTTRVPNPDYILEPTFGRPGH